MELNFLVFCKLTAVGEMFKYIISFLLFYRLSLPMAASDREQLKIELQQVNQQINQQTQMRSMEVC